MYIKYLLLSLITNSYIFSYSYSKQLENGYDYKFCNFIGYNYFKSLNNLELKSCFDVGSRILFSNNWVKVYAHIYLDRTIKEFSWDLTKYFIEFYDEFSTLPIAILTSDILLSDCNVDCLMGVRQFGFNRSINIRLINELDTTVAYLEYSKAKILLYLRRVNKWFNFGIRIKNNTIDTIENTDGLCFKDCDSSIEELDLTQDCIERINKTFAYEICLKSFISLDINLHINKSSILKSCVRDVMLWQDVRSAIDWRWYFIDLRILLNPNIDIFSIESEILNDSIGLVHHEIIKSYQYKLKQIKYCKEDALFKQLTKINIITKKINDFIENDFQEINKICNLKRQNFILGDDKTMFYLPHPHNNTMYIQCDLNGRSFLQSCPRGMKFTINLVCEKLTKRTYEKKYKYKYLLKDFGKNLDIVKPISNRNNFSIKTIKSQSFSLFG
jgi:hypothetical protein